MISLPFRSKSVNNRAFASRLMGSPHVERTNLPPRRRDFPQQEQNQAGISWANAQIAKRKAFVERAASSPTNQMNCLSYEGKPPQPCRTETRVTNRRATISASMEFDAAAPARPRHPAKGSLHQSLKLVRCRDKMIRTRNEYPLRR